MTELRRLGQFPQFESYRPKRDADEDRHLKLIKLDWFAVSLSAIDIYKSYAYSQSSNIAAPQYQTLYCN